MPDGKCQLHAVYRSFQFAAIFLETPPIYLKHCEPASWVPRKLSTNIKTYNSSCSLEDLLKLSTITGYLEIWCLLQELLKRWKMLHTYHTNAKEPKDFTDKSSVPKLTWSHESHSYKPKQLQRVAKNCKWVHHLRCTKPKALKLLSTPMSPASRFWHEPPAAPEIWQETGLFVDFQCKTPELIRRPNMALT